jgi:DNA (cytosine-5)-methyltransferase 1
MTDLTSLSDIKLDHFDLAAFDNSILNYYGFTRNKAYKKDAFTVLKQAYIQGESDEFNDKVAESALDRWLFDIKSSIPFPGPKVGTQRFTFIDLFAGIGGFRLALQKLNGLCLFSSEWNLQAQATYMNNFGERPFGDITKNEVKKYIPKSFDILCAGFPCQPFSRAGVSARNFLGQEHGFKDKQQGNLFFEIIDIANKHKPKVLFLENVKNLKSHDNGNTILTIERMIRELGYSFSKEIVNSQSLVPQRRERTYMVCFKDAKIDFKFPEFEGNPLPLKTILESNVDDIYTISNAMWEGHIKRSRRNKERGTGFTVSLANLEKPSNTLVARYYKDGKECLIPQNGGNPRLLTPRECARLMGFPEEFKFHKSRNSAYQQFGNSVVVPVIERIANEIIKYI